MANSDSKPSFATAKQLDNLKPRPSVYEVGDSGCPGLRVRIHPSGRKSFRWVQAMGGGKTRAVTIGAYGDITLAEARRKLDQLKAQHTDTRGEQSQVKTVADLFELFYESWITPRRKRPEDARMMIDNAILPVIGKRHLDKVTAEQLGSVVGQISARGAVVYAHRCLSLIKLAFKFAKGRGLIPYNIAADLDPEYLGARKAAKRKRWLTAEEIAAFYTALDRADRLDHRLRIAFRLLLLTGQRGGELRLAEWQHIDLDAATWTVPPLNRKMTLAKAAEADPFVVPLATQSVALLKELQELAEGRYVFPGRGGEEPLAERSIAQALRRLFAYTIIEKGRKVPLLSVPQFRPHDLRRTHRTWLAKLGYSSDLAKRCVGHAVTDEIDEIYDRYDYLSERREAQQRFADFVDRTTGADEGVVELRA
jgi:integrase